MHQFCDVSHPYKHVHGKPSYFHTRLFGSLCAHKDHAPAVLIMWGLVRHILNSYMLSACVAHTPPLFPYSGAYRYIFAFLNCIHAPWYTPIHYSWHITEITNQCTGSLNQC